MVLFFHLGHRVLLVEDGFCLLECFNFQVIVFLLDLGCHVDALLYELQKVNQSGVTYILVGLCAFDLLFFLAFQPVFKLVLQG